MGDSGDSETRAHWMMIYESYDFFFDSQALLFEFPPALPSCDPLRQHPYP